MGTTGVGIGSTGVGSTGIGSNGIGSMQTLGDGLSIEWAMMRANSSNADIAGICVKLDCGFTGIPAGRVMYPNTWWALGISSRSSQMRCITTFLSSNVKKVSILSMISCNVRCTLWHSSIS